MSDSLMGIFTAAAVIHVTTRAQLIADGDLIDVTTTAREAGFRVPVAVSRAVWAECVAWSADDNRRKRACQDETGRLWDVVFMAAMAARRRGANDGSGRLYQLHVVRREGRGHMPRPTTLKLMSGPGDDAEHVITILMPDED